MADVRSATEVRIGVMRKVLAFAAVAEIITGLALLIVPSLVGQLLLNEELADITIPVARVTGLALIGLGLACWPGPPTLGMLVYSTLVMLYLAYIGFVGDFRSEERRVGKGVRFWSWT